MFGFAAFRCSASTVTVFGLRRYGVRLAAFRCSTSTGIRSQARTPNPSLYLNGGVLTLESLVRRNATTPRPDHDGYQLQHTPDCCDLSGRRGR